jgi:hypothetical protein
MPSIMHKRTLHAGAGSGQCLILGCTDRLEPHLPIWCASSRLTKYGILVLIICKGDERNEVICQHNLRTAQSNERVPSGKSRVLHLEGGSMVKYVTKDLSKAFVLCLFVVIFSLSLCGCGGTFRSFPGEGDVSGNWNLFLTKSNMSAGGARPFTLTQTDNTISGTTSDGATLTGTISGNTIAFTLSNTDGTTTTLAGTVSDDWKTMSGTYTSTGSDGSGTWSATKNAPTPALEVTPTSATLSCSGGTFATFTVTGGTPSTYSVAPSTNGTLVKLTTSTLTTNGQFTVTAETACAGSNGTIVNLTVTDTATSITVPVTVSNP